MKRRELALVKQIERGTQGPIADAHLNILLELEAIFPDNAGMDTIIFILHFQYFSEA